MQIACICGTWERSVVCFKMPAKLQLALPMVLASVLAAVTVWPEPAWAEKRSFTVLAVEP